MAVFNYENTQRHEGHYPLFLGQQPALHDSINTTYPQIFKLYKKLKSVDWDEGEVDLQQSRFDFENCPKNQYEVMVKTLAYQWELDSIASRSIAPLLAPFVSNSEYWAAISYVSQNEVLHSLTYSEIGRQCFKNPEVLFAEVERNEVTERGYDFGIVFKELEQLGAKYNLGLVDKSDPIVKETIAKTLVALYALEGISFMASFACTFALAQQDLFIGVAKLVQKIMIDECMVASHQLLTPTGWKNIPDVTKEDLVAQYNKDTKEINFVHPIRTSSHFAEKTFKINNYKNNISQHVSEGHRVLLERRPVGLVGVDSFYKPEVIKAKDIVKKDLTSYTRFIGSGLKLNGSKTNLMPEERFLIAAQADGSVSDRYDGSRVGTIPVTFSFSKQRKIDRLIDICKDAKLKLVEGNTQPENGNKKAMRHFRVSVPKEWKPNIKSLSWVNLRDVSNMWAEEFIEELSQWDGYTDKYGTITWGSVSKSNIDIVQSVCALCGFGTHYTEVLDNRKETFNNYHKLVITRSSAFSGDVAFTSGGSIQFTESEGEMVYGVEVESGFLVTKHNEAISITGNCLHTQLDKIVIEILQNDPEWKQTFKDIKPWAKEYLDKVVQRELNWNEYLFSEGRSILGLNKQLLDEWVVWSATPLYKVLNIHNDNIVPESHPIPWLNDWIDIDSHQVAAQEATIVNYVLNATKDDLGDDELEF